MPLTSTFTVGSLTCHTLEAGLQHLDGGAMFGVVPKPLWTRRIPADERNRIPLAMRCLLIEHAAGLILVDTGLGNKEDAKFHDIYGVVNAGTKGATQLEDALAELGRRPEDIDWVVNTHLHFDHAGGNTLADGRVDAQSHRPSTTDMRPGDHASVRLAFPNATYVVQRGELDFARHTNERTRASYLPPNFDPVDRAGKWKLLDGPGEVFPGVSARLTPGHVPFHQSIVIKDGGETAIFLGDVMPTAAHLPLPWIMGYDLEPLRTLESKRALLAQAGAEGWMFIFEHDASVARGRAVSGAKGVELAEVVAAPVGGA
ncbi:MAG TPA: MBL fold metallo-hydrolase [Gemmatimonadales bacterium]|nr:MBL fold metallo-hydrolase [Gemmatimonadales bacterium]